MGELSKRALPCRTDEIERLRQLRGFSVERLAQKAGLHTRTLGRILAGKPAYLDSVERLAGALGVTCDQLVLRSEPMHHGTPSIRFTMQIILAGAAPSAAEAAALSMLLPELTRSLTARGIDLTVSEVKMVTARADGQPDECFMLTRGYYEGNRTWHVVAIRRDCLDMFKAEAASGKFDLATLPYCRILRSAWGYEIPLGDYPILAKLTGLDEASLRISWDHPPPPRRSIP